MNEILLQENQKLFSEKEAHENTEFYFDDSKLYQVNNMIIKDTKIKLNDVSMRLNENLKIHMGLETKMI